MNAQPTKDWGDHVFSNAHWAEQYDSQVKRYCAAFLFNELWSESSIDEDRKQGIDGHLAKWEGQRIAKRIRRIGSGAKLDDCSIRSYNKGRKTEIHKLDKPNGPTWYVYAWVNSKTQKVVKVIIWDIQQAVNFGLVKQLKAGPEFDNGDGTRLRVVTVDWLRNADALLMESRPYWGPDWQRDSCFDGCFNKPERWQVEGKHVVCKQCGKIIGRNHGFDTNAARG